MPRDADGLTLRQRVFVERLTDPKSPTFCKPSASYRAIAPYILPQSARLGAMRMSTDANVQAAIVGQLNMRQLGSKLKQCLKLSTAMMQSDDPTLKLSALREARSTVMDYATLTGQLVRKAEIHTISDEDRRSIASVVGEVLSSPPSVSEQVSPVHEVTPASASVSATARNDGGVAVPASASPSVSEASGAASRPATTSEATPPATESASSNEAMTPTPPPGG